MDMQVGNRLPCGHTVIDPDIVTRGIEVIIKPFTGLCQQIQKRCLLLLRHLEKRRDMPAR